MALALAVLPLGRVRLRLAVLVLSSLVFYGWHAPWLILLLATSILVDWGAALAISRHRSLTRCWVGLSVGANLGLLGLFKVADFGLANVWHAVPGLAQALSLPTELGLPLPLGISFFTFQSMAYTLDVAAGRMEARRSPLTVAAYVALFPQLVAGPIERAGDLMPQLEQPRPATREDLGRGTDLLIWGAVQKLVVADTLALYVDGVFAQPVVGATTLAVAVVGFMVQILADFAGYTCMARGAARLLGIRLRPNFDRPYLAPSPSAFWRRWHQSFSSWMHTYVYRPLSGGQRGTWRQRLATVSSLVLAGLWHGAAWHFVAWGLWFAAVMFAWRPARGWLAARPRLGTALTLGAVWVGMLLFRLPRLGWAADTLQIGHTDGILAVALGPVVVAGGALLTVGGHLQRTPSARRVRGLLWALGLILITCFARDTTRDFVYFRF